MAHYLVIGAEGFVTGRSWARKRVESVTIFQKLSAIWSEDNLLRRVVRNSSYLFGSNVFSSGLGFLQGIVIIRLIGVANLGMVVIIPDLCLEYQSPAVLSHERGGGETPRPGTGGR